MAITPEEAERLQFAIEAARIGFWEVELSSATMKWDSRCKEIFGLPIDYALPYTEAMRQIHPEDLERVTHAMQNALSGRNNGIYDARYRTLGAIDGKLRWVHFSGQVSFDKNGKPVRFGGIAQDVTQLQTAIHETETDLQESESKLRGVVELVGLGTFSIDIPNQQMTFSQRLIEWFGVDPLKADIPTVIGILVENDRERIQKSLFKAMQAGSNGIYDEEYTIVHPVTGKRRVLHAQGKTLFDERGIPLKMVGSAQDITVHRDLQMTLEQEIQQRTEELDVTNEELQAANEELSSTNEELAELNENLLNSNQDLQQFAHVASHDLKEPLRKIKIFLSRLEDDQSNSISPRSQVFIEKMNISANRMFAMIEGVLGYSKLNSDGQYLQPVNINDIIINIVVDLEVLIAQKNAIIDYKDLPVIDGAAILIYQLFYNLIINSLKFSREEEQAIIKISSTFVDRKKEQFCRIEVRDNGIGFDQKYTDRIFGTFIRLNPKDKYEGTGLGLALCKKIVQRHHGTIEAQGTVGEGATFIIYLPVKHIYPSI